MDDPIEEQLHSLQEKYDLVKNDRDLIRCERDSLKRQLLSKENLIAKLEHQNARNKRECDVFVQEREKQISSIMELSMKEGNEKIKGVTHEKERLQQKITELQKQKFDLEGQVAGLRQKLAIAEERSAEIEKYLGLADGQKSIVELKAEIENSKTIIDKLQQDVVSYEKAAVAQEINHRNELKINKDRANSLNMQNIDLRRKCIEFEDELFRLQCASKEFQSQTGLVKDLRSQLAREREFNVRLEAENCGLRSECDYMRAKNEVMVSESKSVEKRIAERESSLIERKKHVELKEKHLRCVQSNRSEESIPKSEFDALNQEFSFLKERIKAFSEFMRNIPVDLKREDVLRKELTSIESRLREIRVSSAAAAVSSK